MYIHIYIYIYIYLYIYIIYICHFVSREFEKNEKETLFLLKIMDFSFETWVYIGSQTSTRWVFDVSSTMPPYDAAPGIHHNLIVSLSVETLIIPKGS